jgi:DNA polymerase-1
MKHLVIVDGHHLLYRAYWAIPRTMKTSKGEQVNTAFGVASMLLQILKTEQPDNIVFCFDADEDTFRHTEYKEYKAGRSATPDDFYPQVPKALAVIDAFGIKSVSGGKMEADDFAATYAVKAAKEGDRVTIVTGDRDLFQLASDKIRIAIPHKGYQEAEYLGPAEILTKYGVTPAQITSYKGLVGDSSDNLPGVHGIGPKAAAALIQKYGSIASIYEHLADIKPAWRDKLTAGKEQAFFCERMATLICDVPMPYKLSELELKDVDAKRVFDTYAALEFSLVAKRFQAFLGTPYGLSHFTGAPEAAFTEVSPVPTTKKAPQKIQIEASQLTLL